MKQLLKWGTLEYRKQKAFVDTKLKSNPRAILCFMFYINVEENSLRCVFRLTEVQPVEGMVSNTRACLSCVSSPTVFRVLGFQRCTITPSGFLLGFRGNDRKVRFK